MSTSTSIQDQLQASLSKINSIDEAIDQLSELLSPLLSSNGLEETLEKFKINGPDEPLKRAKLTTLLAYVVGDLVLIYLKLNGIDPKTHPIMGEMQRVKKYFDKIKDAEVKAKGRQTTLDTTVANRFIKNAIAASTSTTQPQGKGQGQVIGSHLRFDIDGTAITPQAAAKIEARRQRQESTDEEHDNDELEVIDGGDDENDTALQPPPSANSGIGGGVAQRKRKAIDPFEGYDIGPTASTGASGTDTPGTGTGTATGTEEDGEGEGEGEGERRKKKRKRDKKREKRKKNKEEGKVRSTSKMMEVQGHEQLESD